MQSFVRQIQLSGKFADRLKQVYGWMGVQSLHRRILASGEFADCGNQAHGQTGVHNASANAGKSAEEWYEYNTGVYVCAMCGHSLSLLAAYVLLDAQ